jgi:tetratricopeptide (TPR) repeat protein
VGPGVILANRDHVAFAPGKVRVDIQQFLDAESLDHLLNEEFEIAGFLEGFEIPDSREFALWKDRIQARFLPKLTIAFTTLVARCRRQGDIRLIEHMANRMLALDELCEEAVRAKIEVLALAGDRLAALKLYEGWRHKVNEELSAAPSDQLATIAAQLRKRGWERTAVSDIPGPMNDSRRPQTFVGRTSEYKVLYEAWETVRRSERVHVVVLGDSGVGKTTLVDRFTAAASLEGAIVSRVQCYDIEREIPYSTVAGLVHGLIERPEALGTLPEALAELSRIAPQLRHRFNAIPQPKDTQGETARIELTEALHQLLDALTESLPVILVVDDLHLADDASLAVLHLLLRRSLDQRTMLVLIARPGELALGSQAHLFREMAPRLAIQELEVHPLSEDDSSALLSELMVDTPVPPPKTVMKALLEAAAGYPMALELLAQDWKVNGGFALGLAIDAMTVDLCSRDGHSATYEKALTRLTQALDPGAKMVLHLASILGSRLNDLALYNLASLSLGQTMAGLARLTELRLLRDTGRGLEFVNELVRAQVYTSIPSTVRRALHGAIADRLLGEEGTAAESSGLEVAWHCLRAGRRDQATPHLMRGARQAMRQGAPHVAERALESAVPSLTPEDLPNALLLLAEALQEQGRWRESLDVLARLPVTDSIEIRWWTTVLAAVARRYLGASLAEECRAEIPLLMTIVTDSPNGTMRVAAARTVAHFASIDRDAHAAESLLPLVNNIPEEQLDDDAQGQLALTKGLLLWLTGNSHLSYSEVHRAVEALRKRGVENTVLTQLTLGLGTLRMHQGRYAAALEHYHASIRMAKRLGNETQLASIYGNLATCYGRLGDYQQQLRLSQAAPRTWGAEFGGIVELQLTYCEAFSQIMLGRLEDAFVSMEGLDNRLHGTLPAWMFQAWLLWKADLLQCAGKDSEAMRAAARAFSELGLKLHSAGFAGPFARWLHLTGQCRDREGASREVMKSLLASLHTYDALDQVEVLCAARAMRAGAAMDEHTYDGLIAERLRELPAEVRNYLRRVGSLE